MSIDNHLPSSPQVPTVPEGLVQPPTPQPNPETQEENKMDFAKVVAEYPREKFDLSKLKEIAEKTSAERVVISESDGEISANVVYKSDLVVLNVTPNGSFSVNCTSLESSEVGNVDAANLFTYRSCFSTMNSGCIANINFANQTYDTLFNGWQATDDQVVAVLKFLEKNRFSKAADLGDADDIVPVEALASQASFDKWRRNSPADYERYMNHLYAESGLTRPGAGGSTVADSGSSAENSEAYNREIGNERDLLATLSKILGDTAKRAEVTKVLIDFFKGQAPDTSSDLLVSGAITNLSDSLISNSTLSIKPEFKMDYVKLMQDHLKPLVKAELVDPCYNDAMKKVEGSDPSKRDELFKTAFCEAIGDKLKTPAVLDMMRSNISFACAAFDRYDDRAERLSTPLT